MKKKKKILLGIAGGLFVLMIGAYTANALHFRTHFYSGTMINGIDSTEMTADEVKERLAEDTQNYVLTLVKMDGTTETISASQIGLAFEDNQEVDEHLQEQNSWFWIGEMFMDKEHELHVSVSYDETMLEAAIDGLSCM